MCCEYTPHRYIRECCEYVGGPHSFLPTNPRDSPPPPRPHGTDHNPRGIFYGGRELQESHRLLYRFLSDRFASVRGPVTWVDVHTGLGARGTDSLLVHDASSLAEVRTHFPGAASVQDTSAGHEAGEVADSYELARGFIAPFYQRIFDGAARPLLLTQEFGTRHGTLVGRALILE